MKRVPMVKVRKEMCQEREGGEGYWEGERGRERKKGKGKVIREDDQHRDRKRERPTTYIGMDYLARKFAQRRVGRWGDR